MEKEVLSAIYELIGKLYLGVASGQKSEKDSIPARYRSAGSFLSHPSLSFFSSPIVILSTLTSTSPRFWILPYSMFIFEIRVLLSAFQLIHRSSGISSIYFNSVPFLAIVSQINLMFLLFVTNLSSAFPHFQYQYLPTNRGCGICKYFA